jgi:hypothetical protein
MPIQFLIEGTQYEDPLNWDEFAIRLSRDRALNAVIVSYDIDLILGTGAFKYLNDLRLTNQYCEPLKVLIKYHCGNGNWYDLVRGYIFLTECRFNLTTCSVSTKIFDETFSSYIGNNRSIPFITNAGFTKELVPMVPLQAYKLVSFNPKTNIDVRLSWGFKVYDLFEKLIEFISNGKVKFASNFFSNLIPSNIGVDPYELIISSGLLLRGSAAGLKAPPFTITFIQLYEALRSKYNLGMGFQLIDGIPHVLIEQNDFFLEDSVSTTIREADNVTAYYQQELLFNRIQFGSQTFTRQFGSVVENNYLTFPDVPFRGFQDETFYVIGECNIDNILDCFNETPIIIDSNTIEDIVVYDNDDYDNNPVLIQCTTSVFGPAYKLAERTDPLLLGLNVYNGDLTNDNTANYFIGSVPNSIYSSYLGLPASEFYFQVRRNVFPDIGGCVWPPEFLHTFGLVIDLFGSAGQIGESEPAYLSNWNGTLAIPSGNFFPFSDVIFDTGNNYLNTPIFSYVVPGTARIRFQSLITFRTDPCQSGGDVLVNQVLTVYDPERENVLLRLESSTLQYNIFQFDNQPVEFPLFKLWPPLVLPVGCQVCIDIKCQKTFDEDGKIIMVGNDDGENLKNYFLAIEVDPLEGGELKEFNPDDYKRNAYNFEQPISFEQVKLLIENPFKQIKFTYGFQQLQTNKGFIQNLVIKDIDKFETEFTLISST